MNRVISSIFFIIVVHSGVFAQYSFVEDIRRNAKENYYPSFEVGSGYVFISKTSSAKNSDSVLVFKFDGKKYSYHQTLYAPDQDPEERISFGSCMKVHGSNLVIGASYKNNNKGGVYFYHLDEDGHWQLEKIYNHNGPFNYYGSYNLNMYGDTALTSHNNGAPTYKHVFVRTSEGTWELKDTLNAIGYGGFSSQKSFFDGKRHIVSSYVSGRVSEYILNESGEWILKQTINSSHGPMEYFGNCLDVEHDVLVVSDSYYDVKHEGVTLDKAGAVFIFRNSNNMWVPEDTLFSDHPYELGFFGNSVEIANGVIAVSVSVAEKGESNKNKSGIYFYKKENGKWTLKYRLLPLSNWKSYSLSGNQLSYDNGFFFISIAGTVFRIAEGIFDCTYEENGTAFIDLCGVCSGGNTGLIPNTTCTDCNGEINGKAFFDACGVCSGGNTGLLSNASCTDCNGEVNGKASIDECNICAGGSTGIVPGSACVTSVIGEEKGLKVFPNPTENTLNFNSELEYSLYSYLGDLLESGQGMSLSLDNYPSGIYMLKVSEYGFIKIIKK